jgi:hypothetical protein
VLNVRFRENRENNDVFFSIMFTGINLDQHILNKDINRFEYIILNSEHKQNF